MAGHLGRGQNRGGLDRGGLDRAKTAIPSPSFRSQTHRCPPPGLPGAPFQWAAIFHKSDVAFDRGAEGLSFYRSSTCSAAHDLPCKVRCAHCGAPIMDEGRNMALVFPTLVEFRGGAERELFEPQYVPRCPALLSLCPNPTNPPPPNPNPQKI